MDEREGDMPSKSEVESARNSVEQVPSRFILVKWSNFQLLICSIFYAEISSLYPFIANDIGASQSFFSSCNSWCLTICCNLKIKSQSRLTVEVFRMDFFLKEMLDKMFHSTGSYRAPDTKSGARQSYIACFSVGQLLL